MRRVNNRKLRKLVSAVISDLFYNGLTEGQVRQRYDITGREYERVFDMILNSGKITPEQNMERIFRARGHRLKVDRKTVKKITYDVFENYMTRPEICKKYDISRSVFTRAIKLSVDYGFISRGQMIIYRKTAGRRGRNRAIRNLGAIILEQRKSGGYIPEGNIEQLIMKLGREESNRRRDAGRDNWTSLNIDAVKANARKGGEETQKKHGKEVQENLKGVKSYSKNPCYYGEIEFHSEGERFTGLLLVELGLIPSLIAGENFHRHLNGKTEVDFYVNDKLIVEYHPSIKGHKGIESITDEEYTAKRTEQLNGTFKGVVVNITKPTISEYYEKFGLNSRMVFSEFMNRYHAVEQKIKAHDSFFEDEDSEGQPSTDEPAF